MQNLLAVALFLFPVAALGSNPQIRGLPPGAAGGNTSLKDSQRETAPSGDLDQIRKDSQSHVTLQLPSGPAEVYLYAKDQKVDTIVAPYCGGSQGAKEYQGHFELISVGNGRIASRLPLNPEAFFVTGRAHDGLHVLALPAQQQALVKLFQYESCNGESVEFYRLDSKGRLERVRFLDKDGQKLASQATGPDGKIHSSSQGETIFCSYNNFVGRMLCDAYRFKGKDFFQTESWMGTDLESEWQHPTPAAQAERALYEFLSDLADRYYQTAAFYYAGPLPPRTKAEPGSANKSGWLEDYCRMAGGCPNPEGISKPSGRGGNGESDFMVSFTTRDFKTFQMDGKTQFSFRVRHSSSGFRVLDLPPSRP